MPFDHSMIKQFVEKFFGVELRRKNIRISGIFTSIIIIILAYFILVSFNFFYTIDNMIELSKQPWYMAILAKFSFLMIFVNIIFLSLFSTKNNPLGRFVAAFVTQLIGFIGTVILHYLLNNFINISNINSQIKTIDAILPFIVSIATILVIRGIYNVEHFDEKEFFKTK